MNFLEGRQYCGISSLNSAALKWLDEFCNATLNRHTLKTPQEMFEVERNHLLRTKAYINPTGKISSVTEGGVVMYKNNLYTLPRGLYEKNDKVRVQKNSDKLNIFDADSNELVYSLPLAHDKGEIVRDEQFQYSTNMQEQITRLLNNDERLLKFLDGVRGEKPRFMHEQCALIRKINNKFTRPELFETIEHCNNYHKFCAAELIVCLVMKYGIERVAKIINYRTKYNYIERANKLQIELYGGEKNDRD